MTSSSVPANAAVLDGNGQVSQAWRSFFRSLGNDQSRVGDYLQTARPQVDGGWLLCDGSAVSQTTYPALYAVLNGITAPGASPGTFKLPGIPMVYDPAHPDGPPVMATWVRAL